MSYFVESGGASIIQGHTLAGFTLTVLFLITVIFISISRFDVALKATYRKSSTTTSTSQGRSVVVFFVPSGFLRFIESS